jgi:hypothetical protein
VLDPGVADRQVGLVTAASPISEPTSIWSGPIRWRQPESGAPPWMVMVLVPMPSIVGAHGGQEPRQVLHMRLRGAVAQDRRALGATAAQSAFSVAVTEGSSRNTSAPRSLARKIVGAVHA